MTQRVNKNRLFLYYVETFWPSDVLQSNKCVTICQIVGYQTISLLGCISDVWGSETNQEIIVYHVVCASVRARSVACLGSTYFQSLPLSLSPFVPARTRHTCA